MKKILVTGSGGFIGRNIKEYFNDSYNVLAPRSSELDLLDTGKVNQYLSRHKFDIVIHCAADVMSRNFKGDPSKILYNNLRIFFNLAKNSRHFKRMFYFGSGAEYDMRHYIPKMTESYFGTYIPEDYYGFSKYISAQYIPNDPKIIDLRLFGCFGKYENWEVRFISNAMCKRIYDLDISMHQNVFFDYLYVHDLLRILEILIKKSTLSYQHYNVCTGTVIDLKTLASKIRTVSGKKCRIIVEKRGLRLEYSGNNKRLMKELGKFNFTSMDTALQELYDWYNSHKQYIDRKKLLVDP